MTVGHVVDLDTGAVLDRVRRRLAADEPLGRFAGPRLEALTPDRWAIEWHLPWWLAATFGLPRADAEALVESNVLGLLAIRVLDDLDDGDVAPADRSTASTLAAVAMDAALEAYRARFDASSPFWRFFDRTMTIWRAGSNGLRPSDRAAPIKVAASACCLLGERLDMLPAIERCLDRAMTALVLYDQFCDWEADLAAGRPNAFVAEALGRPDPGLAVERDRAAVLTAMLTREVVAEHFEGATAEALAAASIADDLGIDGLASYLRGWADATSAQGESIAAQYRRAADRATRLLFANAPGTSS